MSIQVSQIGAIDISSADFTLPNNAPFLIKNNNEDAVSIEVKPIDNDNFVATTIPGNSWEPILVKAVKAQTGVSNLQYGI